MSGLQVTERLSHAGGTSRMGDRKQVGVVSKGLLESCLSCKEVRRGFCVGRLVVGLDTLSG